MFFIFSCAQKSRLGMIEDPNTGLMYGSIIEKNIVIDPSQFENNSMKISIRNTSGDINYDMDYLKSVLTSAYNGKGYSPTEGSDFGIYFDVNILYSGKIQQNLMHEFGFLGAAGGGLAGYAVKDNAFGASVGVISGATLGSIIGSYVTDDTYIIIAEVSVGVMQRDSGKTKKTVVFSSSKKYENTESSGVKRFSKRISTRLSVYAGGRNVGQNQISEGVRKRIIRIIKDII